MNRRQSAAADEVDDLEIIVRTQLRFSPFHAGNDRQVQFNRQALLRKLKLADQITDIRPRLDGERLTIDRNLNNALSIHGGIIR